MTDDSAPAIPEMLTSETPVAPKDDSAKDKTPNIESPFNDD
jgi:hypothetical protein